MRLKTRLFLFMAIISAFAAPQADGEEYVSGSDQGTAIITTEQQPSESRPAPSTEPKKVNMREPKPGEKLTFKQISTILGTTRDLAGRNLSGLNLVGVDFSYTNLQGADMRGANLERANMMGANLERADLTGANLKMVSFYESAMNAAKLDKAVLDGAIWVDRTVCAKGSTGECLKQEKVKEKPQQAAAPAGTAAKAEEKPKEPAQAR